MICCSTWPGTWCPSDPIGANRAPSNADPKLIRCSTNRAVASSKSPTAAATGKADPAIIVTLTKGHSGRFLILAYWALLRRPDAESAPDAPRPGDLGSSRPAPDSVVHVFAVDITPPAWLQFVRRQQSVQPKQIMDYEEKTRVITKLMQSNPEETTRLERHYEEMVAAYARREKTAQEQMEHLIAEIAKLKGQGD